MVVNQRKEENIITREECHSIKLISNDVYRCMMYDMYDVYMTNKA